VCICNVAREERRNDQHWRVHLKGRTEAGRTGTKTPGLDCAFPSLLSSHPTRILPLPPPVDDGPLVVDDKGDQVAFIAAASKKAAAAAAAAAATTRDISPPRRRPRHDSPSPDNSPPRRRPQRSSPSPDASPPRRTRRQSPSPSPPPRVAAAAQDASPPRRRKRHDSPSPPSRRRAAATTAGIDEDASPPRQRKRHDSPSPSPSPPARARSGKDKDDEEDASPPRQRRRHDSPPSAGDGGAGGGGKDGGRGKEKGDASPPHRRRHDSPSPEARRKKKEEKGEKGGKEEKKEVGLKTGAEFRVELEAKKAAQAQEWAEGAKDQSMTGQNAETVVRDRRGRKLEMLSEFLNQEAFKEGKAAKKAKEEYEWGRGKVQKEKDEEHRKELEDIKNAPFARYENDPTLERARKAEIRTDDPMAAYMMKKQREATVEAAARSGKVLKPEYKGPAPRPNRFNIRPGYRWDGIDRGNGFEGKWFKRQSELVHKHQKDRAWGMSDL